MITAATPPAVEGSIPCAMVLRNPRRDSRNVSIVRTNPNGRALELNWIESLIYTDLAAAFRRSTDRIMPRACTSPWFAATLYFYFVVFPFATVLHPYLSRTLRTEHLPF